MIICYMAALLYLAAAGVLVSGLFHENGPKHKIVLVCASIAIALHGYALFDAIMIEPGQNMSLGNVISLVVWLVALSITLSSAFINNTILLPVIYVFSAALVLMVGAMPSTYVIHVDMQAGLLSHIVFAIFAYCCLFLAFIYALQLAYIDAKLKDKNANLLHSSLPPLMVVQGVLFKLLLAGTVLLTASLISGFAFTEDMFAKEQAHKTVLSIIAWLVYSSVIIGHQKWGWRTKNTINTTVVASILLTLAYFGSRFVREVIIN